MYFLVAIVNDVPGKPGAHQVLVQGNAVKIVPRLLQGRGVTLTLHECIAVSELSCQLTHTMSYTRTHTHTCTHTYTHT